MAQAPEQHWQATPNYPPNYPPNYQPSTAPAAAPATGNPAAGTPAAGQYQNPQQPDQPVGPPQYPTIDRRPAAPAGQPVYGPQPPPDNRTAYPQQDPRAQGVPRANGPAGYGPAGRRAADPRSSRAERRAASAVRALAPGSGGAGKSAHRLGKAEQRDPCPGIEVLSLEVRRRVRQRHSRRRPTKAS